MNQYSFEMEQREREREREREEKRMYDSKLGLHVFEQTMSPKAIETKSLFFGTKKSIGSFFVDLFSRAGATSIIGQCGKIPEDSFLLSLRP